MVDQPRALVNATYRVMEERMDIQSTVAFGPQIVAAANRHHLDPRLLAAVAAQETGGPGSDSGRNIVGDGGHGHGVFQIDDRWHPFASSAAAMDPAANADYAAGMIASNLQRYGGDLRAALSAYNAGSPSATGTRTDWGDGRPLGYADSVLRHYARLGASPAARPAATPQPAPPAADPGATGNSFGQFGLPPGGMLMPMNLPAYRPLPQQDQRDRDLAPSSVLGDDDSLG
jgi:transglycosylase-like protein with SLT domain